MFFSVLSRAGEDEEEGAEMGHSSNIFSSNRHINMLNEDSRGPFYLHWVLIKQND